MSVIVIYIFGFLTLVQEMYQPDAHGVMVFLIYLKNLLTGLQGTINCTIYATDEAGLRLASCLLCISNVDKDEVLEDDKSEKSFDSDYI